MTPSCSLCAGVLRAGEVGGCPHELKLAEFIHYSIETISVLSLSYYVKINTQENFQILSFLLYKCGYSKHAFNISE